MRTLCFAGSRQSDNEGGTIPPAVSLCEAKRNKAAGVIEGGFYECKTTNQRHYCQSVED